MANRSVERVTIVISDEEEDYNAAEGTSDLNHPKPENVKSITSRNAVRQVLIYPPPHQTPHGISINSDDIKCLEFDQCLNDVIIDFYLRYLQEEELTDAQLSETHMFSQFFFTTLNRKTRLPKNMPAAHRRHERVRHWTKNINLFDKNFVIIPIHEPNHWYVVVICFPCLSGPVVVEEAEVQNTKQPCILIFDSLGCGPRSRVAEMLREYLSCEYIRIYGDLNPRVFNQQTMPSFSVKVPQQINHVDCGLYMLEYVEQFFKHPIKDFRIAAFNQQLLNWFDGNVVTKKRENIYNLLETIVSQHFQQNLPLPNIQLPTLNGQIVVDMRGSYRLQKKVRQ